MAIRPGDRPSAPLALEQGARGEHVAGAEQGVGLGHALDDPRHRLGAGGKAARGLDHQPRIRLLAEFLQGLRDSPAIRSRERSLLDEDRLAKAILR